MAQAQSETRKSSPTQRAKPAPGPDAISFLVGEHRAVEKLFDQFEKARLARRKRELATKICQELLSHMQIEEEIFYPATQDLLKDDGIVYESLVEHESGRDRIEKIAKMATSNNLFDAEVHVLGEQMKHHHKEEEEEYFPEVRKKDIDLKALGVRLKARKEELLAKMAKPH